jgi:hypothetical protein
MIFSMPNSDIYRFRWRVSWQKLYILLTLGNCLLINFMVYLDHICVGDNTAAMRIYRMIKRLREMCKSGTSEKWSVDMFSMFSRSLNYHLKVCQTNNKIHKHVMQNQRCVRPKYCSITKRLFSDVLQIRIR